jgi:hypothetical protein
MLAPNGQLDAGSPYLASFRSCLPTALVRILDGRDSGLQDIS